ncbi:MAG: ABC transporter substrate-binding protein [Pirellulales bacterium]|nr:ABC transporter substrate-binding protein [Pirellulales bacterium]
MSSMALGNSVEVGDHPVTTTRAFRMLRVCALLLLMAGLTFLGFAGESEDQAPSTPEGRREVVFWHFWGGRHREIVDDIVRRFNASQDEHFVRAIAMPGQNLDLKFFLSVAGGDPPDLLNQDDPVIGDWAARGAILPLEDFVPAEEIAELEAWLYPAAEKLGTYKGRLFGLCNGLDIRALYYNQDMLTNSGFDGPPQTLEELDEMARAIAPPKSQSGRNYVGYLPDPRRLWAWGIVFGGQFYDETSSQVLVDSPEVVRALEWMAGYAEDYGAEEVAAFRKGDQALAGAAFPLLQGRYAMLMDGQWRVEEMREAAVTARERGEEPISWGVVPLPPPEGGLQNAGWVNGNFFVVPRGGKNPQGAWRFMKFWSGYGGFTKEAAVTAAAGGWIPASESVVKHAEFQAYLQRYPEFRTFVQLAGSPHQVPKPVIPGAAYFDSEVTQAAEAALYRPESPPPLELLRQAARRIRSRLAVKRDR